MTAAAILAIIQGLLGAVPELASLIGTIGNSGTASAADVQAILTKYSVDSAALQVSIAAAKAAGK
jgi:hypothetical protein